MSSLKTAIYIRVSTDKQAEEGYSIEAQTEQLTALCVSKQWKNYELFVDGGWSGSNIQRPEMERLIKEINEGLIERVVVYKLDRLSRSQKDVLHLIEDIFIPNNVDFVSHTESLDTSTPMGRAMIGIIAAFAQLERENIKMRTQMGMLERIKEGYWMGGGRVPYGYDYDKEQGILVPNKDADTVRQMYKLYLEGYSCQAIANMLGMKYDRLVYQVITRKTNYGIINYKGVEYKGRHQPIISKELFDRTMMEMARRSATGVTTSKNLLSGLLVCNKCGAKLRYQKYGTKMRLICYSQQKSKPYLVKDPDCKLERHLAKDIEDIVLNKLFLLQEVKIDKVDSNTQTALDILFGQKENLEKQIKRLYTLYAQSDDNLLLDTINDTKKKLNKLEERIVREMAVESNKTRKVLYNQAINGLANRWTTLSFQQQQNIVRLLVNRILVDDNSIEVELNM